MKIGFIGFGNMAKAIIKGMLSFGFNAKDVFVSDKQNITEDFVNSSTSIDIAKNCEVIILAIKPQNINEVANEIKDYLNDNQIIISILAGVSTTKLKDLLGVNNITRLMPNTAASIGNSATGIFGLKGRQKIIDDICDSFGTSFWVDDEKQIDIITALSGSGPAYFYLFFEIMIKTAKDLGLDEITAKKLCLNTAYGASILARDNNIKTLRANVTSKGGTTETAIKTMLDMRIEDIIKTAMINAKNRAAELNAD